MDDSVRAIRLERTLELARADVRQELGVDDVHEFDLLSHHIGGVTLVETCAANIVETRGLLFRVTAQPPADAGVPRRHVEALCERSLSLERFDMIPHEHIGELLEAGIARI